MCAHACMKYFLIYSLNRTGRIQDQEWTGPGDMSPIFWTFLNFFELFLYFLKWRGRLVFCPHIFGVDIFIFFNALLTLQRLLLSKNAGMISVCQTSHCLCQNCVLWRSHYFNSDMIQRMQIRVAIIRIAIITVTSYLVVGGCCSLPQ